MTNILVVGDLMVDRYLFGAVSRLSPEAPVPVVQVGRELEVVGGAANVALNCRSLGATVSAIGFVGADPEGDFVRTSLEEADVRGRLLSSDVRTTLKMRVLNSQRHMIRVDFETILPPEEGVRLMPVFAEELISHDVVILSDYAKGSLSRVEDIIQACRQAGKPVCVDPKGNDYRRFSGATMLKPNALEFQQATGCDVNDKAFHTVAKALVKSLELSSLVVTKGAAGLSIFLDDGRSADLAALPVTLVDVTGAGDSTMAGYAVALARGLSHLEAADYANRAGALAVTRSGTVTVSREDMKP